MLGLCDALEEGVIVVVMTGRGTVDPVEAEEVVDEAEVESTVLVELLVGDA